MKNFYNKKKKIKERKERKDFMIMCNEPVTTTTKIIMIIICDLLLWDLNFFTFLKDFFV